MTDEELAENYTTFYGFGSDFNNITSQEANQAIEQACFAALKVGRPKWHKVADGDLPKETGEYLTNIGVLIWDYYADGRYGWHTENCEFCDCCKDVDSDEIIAWCEIPEYKEE